jgi:ArsR family transcriptional regulator, arsenate/arsenite/antimonite-responsive transcriptional repressor
MANTHQDHARVFKALCDEKRLEILAMLRGGEECACVLLKQMDISQSTLSYHMKILCDSGIVESWQVGKWTHYRISREGSRYAAELLNALTTEASLASSPDSECC